MAATLQFLAGTPLQDLNGQGLGFYGPGNFGSSVRTGQYQDNTYASSDTGTAQGQKVPNCKYLNSTTVQLGTSDQHALLDVPNSLATLCVRLTSDTPCLVQNATATAFDRSNTANPPVGVTCKIAQIIHPSTQMNPSAPTGIGSTTWSTPGGAGGTINGRVYDAPLGLANSPGPNSINAGGAAVAATVHEWFLAISASPDSIGTKTQFGLSVSMEYL